MHRVQIFFTTKFFPAYQHEKALREKIKENRLRDVELAKLRKIKDEELARWVLYLCLKYCYLLPSANKTIENEKCALIKSRSIL